MQMDYQDVYNSDPTLSDPPGPSGSGSASQLNPGDPGTYYGSDNVWYGPDGVPLANQGRAGGAPPVARTPPPNGGLNGQPNVADNTPAPSPTPVPAPNPGGGVLAPYSAAPPPFPQQPAFKGLDMYQPTTFSAPTIADALNNPGYKFRVQQGEDALQNWAAARGTLNDSGTAKSLIDYGQSAAEQGYGEVYARNFNDWQANEAARYGAWTTNENALERAYGLNRQTQYIDPWTAAYNTWAQQGNFYLQNQGTVANTALSFANLVR